MRSPAPSDPRDRPPWPADDPRFRTYFVHLPKGLRVRVVECGPADGSPVVLVHGWACSAYLFSRNLPALAAAGRRAIAFDLVGHGYSDPLPDDAAYAPSVLRDSVVATLDALGLRRVVLGGQSMGGRIAIDVALVAGERVRALALISAVGLARLRVEALTRLASWRILRTVFEIVRSRAVVARLLALTYGDPARLELLDVDEYWRPLRSHVVRRSLLRALAEFDWGELSEGKLSRLACPVLAIFGTLDPLLAPPRGVIASRLAAASVRHLDGAGHIPNLEVADSVNEILVTWLSGSPSN